MSKKKELKNRAKYKFVTTQDVRIQQGYLRGRAFRSPWLEIQPDGSIIIFKNEKGYAWDGCSPKFVVLDLLFGTPDGALTESSHLPVTWFASLVHDAIYQYKGQAPVTRYEADRLFFIMLEEERFFWRYVYYFFVRAFGWIYGSWLNRVRRPFKSWDWFDWFVTAASLAAAIDILTRIYL